jgi:hypothetical protein
LHIVPDWEGVETSVVLPGDETFSGMFIPFDGADSAPAEEFAAKYAASSACE